MTAVHFESFSDARNNFRELLDAASQGRVATVRRNTDLAAVVDVTRLKHFLRSLAPRVQVMSEAGGWSAIIPGLPIAADGATFDEAIDELIDALREYAVDWHNGLLHAPNHRDNWGLVQLIALSDDNELHSWIRGD